MGALIGTSGWQYASWRERYYPRGLPQRSWLAYYAGGFAHVEVNNTFYQLPAETTVAGWAEAVRDVEDFHFVVKASRYLTHIRRLQEPEQPVETLLERMRPLGSRLDCVLVQLPPTMRVQPERLDATLRAFGSRVRVAVEFRHPSWFVEEIREVLCAWGAALCLSDRHGRLQEKVPWVTADFGYVRFHEGCAAPRPCYGDAALRSWAQRLRDLWPPHADVYTFFNNDPNGCAPRDAARFAGHVRRAGGRASRVPPVRSLRSG